jgi:hypothetical protein
MPEIPEYVTQILNTAWGVILLALGISFIYKFFQAAIFGKLTYWTGIDNYGITPVWFTFKPLARAATPFFCHLPYGKDSLITTIQQIWVHFFSIFFFAAAVVCVTWGADTLGLPGASTVNYVLSGGRTDMPPIIRYKPRTKKGKLRVIPYTFPIVKRAEKTVFKAATTKIPFDRAKSLNEFERRGQNVEEYTKIGEDWFKDDD